MIDFMLDKIVIDLLLSYFSSPFYGHIFFVRICFTLTSGLYISLKHEGTFIHFAEIYANSLQNKLPSPYSDYRTFSFSGRGVNLSGI